MSQPDKEPITNSLPESLISVISADTRVAVLTGAGCSTASGLGDYRDKTGNWKRKQPITGQLFRADKTARHRYWARSSIGWPAFSQARPSLAHRALAELERADIVQHLVTQNVDQLHQRAGHQSVIDLHGVLATVSCISCGLLVSRDDFQQQLLTDNAWLTTLSASYAPDGDADLDTNNELLEQLNQMQIPDCPRCHDLMKPDVVFFGENVPTSRVELAMEQVRAADVLLVAGSSLMVFSGYRFCRDAWQRGQPIVILNDGKTRADELAMVKVSGDCGALLNELAKQYSKLDT